MKKSTYLLSAVMVLGLCLETLSMKAQTDQERFFNVEAYKAEITLTFNYQFIESESDYDHAIIISQKFQHTYITTPGEISIADMFQVERGDEGDNKAHKGDIMEGVDMDAVAQAMKNSGVDPSVMDELKKTKRETQTYNMGFGKYKTWMTNAVSGGLVSSEIFTEYSEKESGSIHCGEGQGMGTFKSEKDYDYSENMGPSKPDMLNPNSFVFLINLDNNSYSFSSTIEFPRGSKFNGNMYYTSCGTSENKTLEYNTGSNLNMDVKKGWIYKQPLPDSGMILSGNTTFTNKSSLPGSVKSEEGATWSVEIEWKIYPVICR